MADTFDFSVDGAASAAEVALARGRNADAIVHLRQLTSQTHVADYEYDDWLRKLAGAYLALGRLRETGWIQVYLHDFPGALQAFAGEALAADRGAALMLQKRHLEAAEAFTQARRPVQAAIAHEEANDAAAAKAGWAELLARGGLGNRPYERALCHFNLGIAARKAGDPEGARHLIAAQRVLEQVADEFESAGERERAFDCYLILLELGKVSGQFENLAEGYLNCIRVLREDGLKFYALQFYEDFIRLALAAGELAAAASLYREAGDYATRSGLPYARHYLREGGRTWRKAAESTLTGGGPLQLAENALLAGIGCSSALGDFADVRAGYERLAELSLGERAQARYRAIAERFAGAPAGGEAVVEFPAYLRQPHAYTDIWFVDLVEWEMGGDPASVASLIIGDLRYPDGFRRRALNVLLTTGDAAAAGTTEHPETLVRIATALGELQSYAALRPLEKLFEHGDPDVRRAAVTALRYLHFKRSFGLVRKALIDPEPRVRQAGLAALGGLHFGHAFQPLARLVNDSRDDAIRAAAIDTLGKIGSIEAGELLLSVLRQDTGVIREAASKALAGIDNADVWAIVRQALEVESDEAVRDLLARMVATRGK
jgi:hypothetical protein